MLQTADQVEEQLATPAQISSPVATTHAAPRSTQIARVVGLDAIRALCAIWVVFTHTESPPILAGIDKSHRLGWLINGIYGNLFNGPAAVIVFFVISGFCIHAMHAASLRIPSLTEYVLRRYVRIMVPMAAVIAISFGMGRPLSILQGSVLWSLICELVYYTLYPCLLGVRRSRGSWNALIVVAYVAAFAVAATAPAAKDYPSYGFVLNWILGLPCWLLGCSLAEQIYRGDDSTVRSVWRWRLIVLGASAFCSVLRYHSPVGYPWTLNLFALLVPGWLASEIAHFRTRPPLRVLEWIGVWSYSLYLTHPLIKAAYKTVQWPNLGYLLNWMWLMAIILVGGFVFYLAIERPSHQLARWLGRRASGAKRVGA